MNQKVYHTLEYYKILDMLAGYASCEETRKRALALTPITDAAEEISGSTYVLSS